MYDVSGIGKSGHVIHPALISRVMQHLQYLNNQGSINDKMFLVTVFCRQMHVSSHRSQSSCV